MDDPQLSSVLLNIQQRLNDNDRQRLDLYLKNDIPRLTTVNSRLNQTLKLIQSRFDRDKIDEKQLISLIDAFHRIRCFDAVQLLKEHQRRMTSKGLKESALNLTSIMPPHNQQLEGANEYEDINDTKISIQNQADHRSSNTYDTIASKNLIINEDKEKQSFPRKPCFCVPLLKNKYFLLPSILLLLVLGLLGLVLIGGRNRIYHVEINLQISWKYLIEAQNEKTNQTVQQLNKLLSEKNATVEQLNMTLIEMQSRKSTSLIIAGRLFGGCWGDDFDDSALSNFTSSHYLSEILFPDTNTLYAWQFIYTSSRDSSNRIESNIYGNNGSRNNLTRRHHLAANERIRHVQVRSSDKGSYGQNDDIYTRKLITGLTFTTTNNRTIPDGIALTGDDIAYEEFTGYTLGYVTGKSRNSISQLQFFWYRTEQ